MSENSLDYRDVFSYLLGMEKKNKFENYNNDNIDRLGKVAFWYWEYMRRNFLYIKYCIKIEEYLEIFEDVGELEFINSKEFFDLCINYINNNNTRDLKDNFFSNYLEEKHGEGAGVFGLKFMFLANGYNKFFKRTYKPYRDGMYPKYVLSKLNKNDKEKFFFTTKDPYDIYAVLGLRNDWILSIDGSEPGMYHGIFTDYDNIKIDTNKIKLKYGGVDIECKALKVYKEMIPRLFSAKDVEYDTQKYIYKLGCSGRYIDPKSDLMRLAMLWLWDTAYILEADTCITNPKDFDYVYPKLLKEFKFGCLSELYTQLQNKTRIRDYYHATEYCIENRTVVPLTFKDVT